MTDIRTDSAFSSGRFTKVMDQCRDIVLIFSNAQLTELFEQAGDALLDFAERAENNTMQGRFFEAMNLIQRKRPDMEQVFRREVAKGLDEFRSLAPPSRDAEGERADGDESELSLVDPEEMEESVATENIIIKANANYFPELYSLSQRLSVIQGGRKLKDYEIPGGPNHLVHAFRSAIALLDVDFKVKVILYALFDRFVIKQAKGLYDELNSTLKAAGILPNLKPVYTRPIEAATRPGTKPQTKEGPKEAQPDDRGSQGQDQSMGQGPPSLGEELFGSIIELMSTRRTLGRASGHKAPAGQHQAMDPATAAALGRQLVSALDAVQAQSASAGVAHLIGPTGKIPNLELDAAFLEKVKHTLSEEREQVLSQVDREKLSPMDVDLIDLIGMLFEYMLNDPVLPNLAKALLSHLHTPYLKVALIDRRLLVDPQHPARRLLDQMVEAGSLWVDEANPRRGIFPLMQRVVDRVLQEFKDDIAIFEELLETFEQAMAEQQRRTDTMEQRTQEAARGRERLQLAKRRATHQIQTLLKQHPLPQGVVSFLSKTWLDQLVFIVLREKEEERSDAWREAVQTANDLTALFDPDVAKTVRQTRAEAVPRLKRRISEGVQRMGSFSHALLDNLFTLMDQASGWQPAPTAGSALSGEDTGTQTEGRDLPPLPEAPPISSAHISEQEQEVINRLRKMKFGTWFELSPEIGAPPRRIKLSWLSPLTSTCMFVDRSGMQAEIKTLQELAHEILSGRARIIPRPRHPFIERALVSIRKMLQGDEYRGASPAQSQ